MSKKSNYILAGISAASALFASRKAALKCALEPRTHFKTRVQPSCWCIAVAVLSVGGYFLHRKVLKYRLREQARRFSMNLAVFNPYNDKDLYNDFDDYDDDSDDGDYIKNLMQDFDTEDYDE